MFRRAILPAAMLLIALVADTAILPTVTDHWLLPILTFVTANCYGAIFGNTRGMLFGIAGGLLMDVSVNAAPGMWTVAMAIAGYVGGALGFEGDASNESGASAIAVEAYAPKAKRVRRRALSGVLCRGALEFSMLAYAIAVSVRFDAALLAQIPARAALDGALVPILFVFYKWAIGPTARALGAKGGAK